MSFFLFLAIELSDQLSINNRHIITSVERGSLPGELMPESEMMFVIVLAARAGDA